MPNTSFFQGTSRDTATVAADQSAPRTKYISPPQHKNRVLANLPVRDFALIAKHLHVISVGAGAVLQNQGQPLDYAYFPHEGALSLLAMAPEGRSMQAASVGRDGAVCAILDADVSENFLTAVSMGAIRVSRLAVAQLRALQRESQALSRTLDACRHALLLQLRQNLLCNGLHSLEQRLARWLLETADRFGTGATPVQVTQADVAHRLGVRRNSVTLIASTLRDRGAIRWGRSRVQIVDRARLEPMACDCYTALRERVSPGIECSS